MATWAGLNKNAGGSTPTATKAPAKLKGWAALNASATKPAVNKFGSDVSTHVANPLNPNNQNTPFPKVNPIKEALSPKSLFGAVKKIRGYLYDTAGQIVAPGITHEELRDPKILSDTLGGLSLVNTSGPILNKDFSPYKIGKQAVRHPLDTSADIVTSVIKGLSDTITSGIINVAVPKQDREITKVQVEETLNKYLRIPSNDPTRLGIGEGFHAGGSAAPFILAGGVGAELGGMAGLAGASRAGIGLKGASTAISVGEGVGTTAGFLGAGQTQVPIEATVKERANQMMNDLVGLGLFVAGGALYNTIKSQATVAIRKSLVGSEPGTLPTGFPKANPIPPEIQATAAERAGFASKSVSDTISPMDALKPQTAEEFVNSKSAKLRTEPEVFKGFKDLTTKTLDKLVGRSTVSKQFISDLTNSADMKQAERDLIRKALADEGDVVNVKDFANKVKTELLPLERSDPYYQGKSSKYENVALPDELRGNVANYNEHIYNSPIKTSAGDVHFQGAESMNQNYFAHTRVEDMATNSDTARRGPHKTIANDTRRVIELQSDLFQKGRLESEANTVRRDGGSAIIEKRLAQRAKEITPLEPYRNTWHERVIREEVKQAAIDGKTKLQFPTGETAMKIEGLGGDNVQWKIGDKPHYDNPNLTAQDLKVGKQISNGSTLADQWIITDVLGDGKFKAVSKGNLDLAKIRNPKNPLAEFDKQNFQYQKESFDISGKVDTNNPIYKFYEKEVGRYLKNKYGAERVTDKNGVSWWELNVDKKAAKAPVEAFRIKDDLAKVGIKITDAQEQKIKALNKQIFGDANVKIMDQILSNKDALGSYQDSIIKIVNGKGDPLDTFYHEAVHKYLDVFTTKAEHVELLKAAQKEYGLESFKAVEEKLAEDFIRYAKTKEGVTGKIKLYFDKVLLRIKSYLGNENKINQLYNDILSKKAKETSAQESVSGRVTQEKGTTGKATSKVATSIETKTVEKGLSEGFKELAGYEKIDIAEQAKLAADLMAKDMEKAKAMVQGEIPMEGKLMPEMLIKAMEDYAQAKGDAQLSMDIANSPLVSGTSVHAQAMRLLAERNPDSVVAKLREIKQAREEALIKRAGKGKSVDKLKGEEVKKIKAEIKKTAPTKETWASFVESIKC